MLTHHVPKPRTEGCSLPHPFLPLPAYQETRLEIGAGVGFHAIQHAKEHPGILLVAIERTQEKFQKFKGRFERHPQLHAYKNLFAIHGDAIGWCTHELTEYRWDRVFLLYPNPNPKNAKSRWINQPFFGTVLEQCKPGATLEFATNIESYAQEFEIQALKKWNLICSFKQVFNRDSAPSGFTPRTHFEKKYFERGETLHHLQFQRKN